MKARRRKFGDRFSFLAFLALSLGDEIPDANTAWDFKELIEKENWDGSRKLFEVFHSTLARQGLMEKEGRIVAASFVEAPRQRNTREENQKIKDRELPQELAPTKARKEFENLEKTALRWHKKIKTGRRAGLKSCKIFRHETHCPKQDSRRCPRENLERSLKPPLCVCPIE